MYTAEVILYGFIVLVGIGWQGMLFEKDKESMDGPDRIVVPVGFGVLVILGIITHGVIAVIFDDRSNYTFSDMFVNLWKAFVLFATFTIKSYLGPIFTTLATVTLIYFWIHHGEFFILKFVKIMFEWIFSRMPGWVENLYIFILLLFSIGGSIHDSIDA